MIHCAETSAYRVRTKSRSQSRHELLVPEERKSSGEPGAACLRLGRAHQRSHQRSRSAHSHGGPQAPERKISAFNSEIAKPLQAQFQVRWLEDCGENVCGGFQNYSRHGDRRGAATQLTLSQSDKWLKQVGGQIGLGRSLR